MMPWKAPSAVWFTVRVVVELRKMLAVLPALPLIAPERGPTVGAEPVRNKPVCVGMIPLLALLIARGPVPRLPLPETNTEPELMVVPPPYVLAPVKIRAPVPFMVSVPAVPVPMMPAMLTLPAPATVKL